MKGRPRFYSDILTHIGLSPSSRPEMKSWTSSSYDLSLIWGDCTGIGLQTFPTDAYYEIWAKERVEAVQAARPPPYSAAFYARLDAKLAEIAAHEVEIA